MIAFQTGKRAETIGVGDVTDFRIEASIESFIIMSKKMYSDGLLAPIRELITNAWDSHKMAGRENVPIEIHLPNPLEPYFSVKDFGLGLSHDDVKNTYTVYFRSTKRDSNVSTGCLGLGSKSPYAYEDCSQYIVTSIYDKVKTVYSCFLDNGLPRCVAMSTEATDEGNGVEVRFDVKKEDFNEFMHKTHAILRHFPNCVVEGRGEYNTLPDLEENVISAEANASYPWRIFKCGNLSNRVFVVQGHVRYPIDIEKVDSPTLRTFSYGGYNTRLEVIIPIGTASVAPSREALSYDDGTVANLKDVFAAVCEDIVKSFTKKVNEAKTEWQAVTIMHEHQHLVDKFAIKNIVWQGKPITGSIAVPRKYDTSGVGLPFGFQLKMVTYSSFKRRKFNIRDIDSQSFCPSPDCNIYIADRRGFRNRVLATIDQGRYANGKHDGSVGDIVITFDDEYSDKDRDAIIAALGNPEYTMVSSLPNPCASVGFAGGNGMPSIKRGEIRGFGDGKLEDVRFDPAQNKYYMTRKRDHIIFNDIEISHNDFFDFLGSIGMDTDEVVFVTDTYMGTRGFKRLNLLPLVDEIKSRLAGYCRYNVSQIEATSINKYDMNADLAVMLAAFQGFDARHPIGKVVSLAKKIKKIRADDAARKIRVSHNSTILSQLKLSIGKKDTKIGTVFAKAVTAAINKYPMVRLAFDMVKHHRSHYIDAQTIWKNLLTQDTIDYIKTVDNG